MNLSAEKDITNQLDQDEVITFSCDISKQNRFGFWQKRHLLLTTTRLINLHGNKVKRGIQLPKISALTKSTETGNFNFIVHIEDEYDYGCICKEREELVQMIQKCYHDLMGRDLLIYGV